MRLWGRKKVGECACAVNLGNARLHGMEAHTDMLRLAEAAALLGVHPDTLRRWTDEGKVPCTRTPGGQRRYTREAIAAVYITP